MFVPDEMKFSLGIPDLLLYSQQYEVIVLIMLLAKHKHKMLEKSFAYGFIWSYKF